MHGIECRLLANITSDEEQIQFCVQIVGVSYQMTEFPGSAPALPA